MKNSFATAGIISVYLFILYSLEYFIRLIHYRNMDLAFIEISVLKEKLMIESDITYLKEVLSFMKYMFN
jgi:hypothetical protein